MSLLLNALKKAEEGEQPSEQSSAEATPGEQAAPAAAPTGQAAPVDFDQIDIEQPTEQAAAAEAGGGGDKQQRRHVEASRVFGASEAEESSSSSSGGFMKLLYSLLGVAVVAGGGYFVLVAGVIPGVDLRAIGSLLGLQEEQVVTQPQAATDIGSQLTVSEDVVLLPVPAVDVQAKVDFAALRLPENNKAAVGEKEYARQIAYLTGFDINKERTRATEERSQLRLDLEIPEVEGEEGVVEAIEGNEEVQSEELITYTADASRLVKFVLDASTPSDQQLDIAINSEVPADVDLTDTDTAPQQVAQVAQVEVKQSQEGRERQRMIGQARALYNNGSYLEAETIYRSVLVMLPTSRDALRGIAQIAVVTGRYQTAVATYLDLLGYYPNDPVAIAELTNFRGANGNFYEIEKALKDALGDIPAADGRLYFSLGNLYAQSGKLLEAQQAYFEAFSRETNNPDYAYNLAVMLDHLNKPTLAVRYYEEALKLAKEVPVGFNRDETQARINDLN